MGSFLRMRWAVGQLFVHQTFFAISKGYILLAFQNSLQSAEYQYSGLYSQLFEA